MISIIMPVYNVKPFIRRAIQSVLKQEYGDFELILVDDGSTDGCSNICDEYEKKDKRVKVIHKTNGGLDSARNAGLKAFSGEILTFIDPDDYITQGYFKSIHDIFEAHKDVDMIVYEWKSIQEKTNLLVEHHIVLNGYYDARQYIEKVISLEFIYGGGFTWNKVWRIGENRIVPRFHEDLWCFEDKLWCVEMLKGRKKIWINNSSYYNYIIRETSLSHDLRRESERKINAVETYKKIIKALETDKEAQKYALKVLDMLIVLYSYDALKNKEMETYSTLQKESFRMKSLYKEGIKIFIKALILKVDRVFVNGQDQK